MINKRLLSIVLAISVVMGGVLLQTAEAKEKVYKIKLSHGAPTTHALHRAAVKFQELAAEYSNNKMNVTIFPNNQLGGEQEVLQDVKTNAVNMEILYTGNLQPFAPSVGVLMLPYMFTSNEEAWAAMDALADELNKRIVKEANVRILGYFEMGFRFLTNSKKPVHTLADLQGLKIRVSKTAVAIETFKSWDLEPIPMAWDEVFSALQTKVIDGQENPYTTIAGMKFYEIQKYITEMHYLIWTGPFIINESYFQSLPADLQQGLVKAGKDAADYARKIMFEANEKDKQMCIEKGMVIAGPPKDEPEWKKRAQSIWPKFYDKVGGEEWVNQAVKIIEAAMKK